MNDENAIHFSGYNDLITRKRVTFWVFIFNEWWKRVSFSGYNDQIIRKRVTFWIFIFDEWWKRGSFFGYNDLIIRKRITFFGYIDLGIYKSVALPPCPYLLFLSWYKKRRQKKIKASAEAGEVDRIHDWSWKRTTFLGYNDNVIWKRGTFWGYNDLNVRERHKKTAPPLGRCRLRYGIRWVYRPISPLLYRSTTTRLARVRACTPGAYMAAQRMAGRTNEPAYEACNRTRNVFVSPLLRSK